MKKNALSTKTGTAINKTAYKSQSTENINRLIKAYKEGETLLAKKIALQITNNEPSNQLGWKVLGALYLKEGALHQSLEANQKAVSLSTEDAAVYINLGIVFTRLQRDAEAEASYRSALRIDPSIAEAHYNLGNLLTRIGKLKDASILFKNAIALKSNFAEAHYNLGNSLKALGVFHDAIAAYQAAVLLRENYVEAINNIGVVYQDLGDYSESEKYFIDSIKFNPGYAEAHNNYGVTLTQLGLRDKAVFFYENAIKLKPEYSEAYCNLGINFQGLGKLASAKDCYQKAILLKPDYAEAHSLLGLAYLESNNVDDAFNEAIRSLKIKPTVHAKSLFTDITKKIRPKIWNAELARIMTLALSEPFERPIELQIFACKLIKLDPLIIESINSLKNADIDEGCLDIRIDSLIDQKYVTSQLLKAMLCASPIPDINLENFLTALRRHFLDLEYGRLNINSVAFEPSELCCSLAQQCFINEYIFHQITIEKVRAQSLKAKLEEILKTGCNAPSSLVVVVGCYFPLHLVLGSELLLKNDWRKEVKAVLIQQIEEPMSEENMQRSISLISEVDDSTSIKVQHQYEANPYPRWVSLPKESINKFLNQYIVNKFPSSEFLKLSSDKHPEILIAGCGTGQHPIGTAQAIRGANILAVDLSLSSLAYAKRKTSQFGIQSIEYAQADILKLGTIGRTFDVIESVGVLHHLHNPFLGWDVLLSLLRPGGLMRLGMYSQIARQDVTKARHLFQSFGKSFDKLVEDNITEFRRYLCRLPSQDQFDGLANSGDFYSTSACRDLLFHVQEHCMSLGMISRYISENDLTFLGFDIDRIVISDYKTQYPNDIAATNLFQWDQYERKHPNTFKRMYQFWIQKN
jgi:tetratricopeptide (TPR) repeat protein/2-polyprenyl-3-methyl-5-hydroxy-6-metoxy-1,4-benzoquinol methylase